MPAFKPLKPSAAASTKPGSQPLLLQGCSLPFPGRQRSSIAACPLPAHSPLLLRHSSLPFASLQTLKPLKPPLCHSFHQASRVAACPFLAAGSFLQAPLVTAFEPAVCQPSQPLKLLQALAAASTKLLAVSVPALQPALCLHIALSCCSLPFPGRQRSSAACPLPAHSPLLLRHSSLPASLQTPKTLRGSFPKPRQLPPSPFLAVSVPVAACPLPAHSPLLLGHSSLPFASLQTPKTPKTLRGSFHQPGRQPLPPGLQPALSWPSAFHHCSLPFACT